MADYSSVNLHHQLQDVHRTRNERPGLARFKIAGMLLPMPEHPASVLEIGCGRCEFARIISEAGYEVAVTDLSTTNIEYAKSLGFEAHQSDLNTGLPDFADKSFDGIVILDVIEHIIPAEYVMGEIYRVLRPGGFLLLSTPNFVFWQNRLRILFGRLTIDEGYHYRFFTLRSLGNLLEVAGLRIEVWRFATPAFGLNRVRRWLKKQKRHYWLVPYWLAPLLAQTMFIRARK